MASVGALGLLAAVLLVQNVGATQFAVGGSSGWGVPSDNGAAYNQWAQRMRFQMGDSLLFVYPSSSDSVLRVTKEDFSSCNCASPLEKHTDGHTVVRLSESGPHYFISGNKDNCQKSEKLVVVVLADRANKGPSPAPAPAPSSSTPPPPIPTPAPAPLSTASPPAPPVQTPSPAPAAPTTDQSPPSPTPEATSTPAPTQDDNHNDASKVTNRRVVVGVFACLGALLVAI